MSFEMAALKNQLKTKALPAKQTQMKKRLREWESLPVYDSPVAATTSGPGGLPLLIRTPVILNKAHPEDLL